MEMIIRKENMATTLTPAQITLIAPTPSTSSPSQSKRNTIIYPQSSRRMTPLIILLLLNFLNERCYYCNGFVIPSQTSSLVKHYPFPSSMFIDERKYKTTSSSSSSSSSSSLSSLNIDAGSDTITTAQNPNPFSLPLTLLTAGLAFDSYTEPPPESSRWERGTSGLNVAFLSPSFTKTLYNGLLCITPIAAYDLPREGASSESKGGIVESILSGSGTDAYLLVAVAEGNWKEDIADIDKAGTYHDGVLALNGCAHIGRSNTAWSNVDEKKVLKNQQKQQKALMKKKKKNASSSSDVPVSASYYIPPVDASLFEKMGVNQKGGTAVWKNDPSFYLYVQDPKKARLAFTVMDDKKITLEKSLNVMGSIGGGGNDDGGKKKNEGGTGGVAVGSCHRELVDLINGAGFEGDVVERAKESVLQRMMNKTKKKDDNINTEDVANEEEWDNVISEATGAGTWQGKIKLTSRPKISGSDKNNNVMAGVAAGAMMGGPAGAAVGGLVGGMYGGKVSIVSRKLYVYFEMCVLCNFYGLCLIWFGLGYMIWFICFVLYCITNFVLVMDLVVFFLESDNNKNQKLFVE